MVARTQSQFARWRSPSNVLREKPLNGAGRPVAPFGPGAVPLFVRLKTYERRCALLSTWSIFRLYFFVVSMLLLPSEA